MFITMNKLWIAAFASFLSVTQPSSAVDFEQQVQEACGRDFSRVRDKACAKAMFALADSKIPEWYEQVPDEARKTCDEESWICVIPYKLVPKKKQ